MLLPWSRHAVVRFRNVPVRSAAHRNVILTIVVGERHSPVFDLWPGAILHKARGRARAFCLNLVLF